MKIGKQQALAMIAESMRALLPEELDFIVIIYPAGDAKNPKTIDYACGISEGRPVNEPLDAAAAFIVTHKANINEHQS